MNLSDLHRFLDNPSAAEALLRPWGVSDPVRAHASLRRLAELTLQDSSVSAGAGL